MSMKTRPLVIAKFEEFIRNKLITINSMRLANEIKTFVWHNGRPQAMRSYNDDLVIAARLGVGSGTQPYVLISGRLIKKALLIRYFSIKYST